MSTLPFLHAAYSGAVPSKHKSIDAPRSSSIVANAHIDCGDQVPTNARNPKRRPIPLAPLIDRGTRIEQHARCVDVPFQTHNGQRRVAVIILLVDASALLKKSAYRVNAALIACERQWRRAAIDAQLPHRFPKATKSPLVSLLTVKADTLSSK